MPARRLLLLCLLAASAVLMASCSIGLNQSILLRSDMPTQGMEANVAYRITSAPDGKSEINEAVLSGMNDVSPLPLLTTTFGKGAGTVTQRVQATASDGSAMNVLGMTKQQLGFGLHDALTVDSATYELHDAAGLRVCGAKVRMLWLPDAAKFIAGDTRSWDAIWYYDVPCAADQPKLDISRATFHALVITQQFAPRITGKPLFYNRGNSVTIVGGQPAAFAGGWWTRNARPDNANSILGAQALVKNLVVDLDHNGWMKFSPSGPYKDSALVYSAGDADVYASFNRAFLDRQVDYIVNFRSSPSRPWRKIVVHPIYNLEWNDFAQNWEASKGFNPLHIDDRLDKNGFPKDANDSVLKEVETAGCQNCPNPTLEQIQIKDGDSGKVLYAMTIRGYIGAESSMVMFGQVPGSLQSFKDTASTEAKTTGLSSCPIRYDDKGEALDADKQISAGDCARLLREGALWQLITEDPHKFGFDLVGQFRVRDESLWKQVCSGSGDSLSCSTIRQTSDLKANYLFDGLDVSKPWTVLQLLGEVGVRTLGLSYASGQFAGSGLLFGMSQPLMRQQYFGGITDPEMVFGFDARAMQLPNTLGQAENLLYPPK